MDTGNVGEDPPKDVAVGSEPWRAWRCVNVFLKGATKDFELTEDQRRFRDDLCQYLRGELTPEVKRANADPDESSGLKHSLVVNFRRKLAENGYLAVGWPTEYGGGGRDLVYQVLAFEEMDYHGVPSLNPTYAYVTQAIIMLGSEEQKQLLLPRLTKGELDIVVGYSEPEAGSDLANLQTRAVLEGDEFVINGQKLFSSGANNAQYAWLAVRTDPDSPKHRGISLLIVDMKTPGITLARYRTMGDWWHHGMHFDNVRVPRSMLVGELNWGWYHIMVAIDFERAANGNPGHTVWLYDLLVQYCKETSARRQGPHRRPVGGEPAGRPGGGCAVQSAGGLLGGLHARSGDEPRARDRPGNHGDAGDGSQGHGGPYGADWVPCSATAGLQVGAPGRRRGVRLPGRDVLQFCGGWLRHHPERDRQPGPGSAPGLGNGADQGLVAWAFALRHPKG